MTYDLKISHLKSTDLKIPDWNAQIHDEENISMIKESIVNLGYADPIIVRESDNLIISGVGRFLALQELWNEGYNAVKQDLVPVILIECDDITAKKLSIALNKIQSIPSFTKLSELFADLIKSGEPIESLTVTGYQPFEINDLLNYKTDVITDIVSQITSSKEEKKPVEPIESITTVERRFKIPLDLVKIVDEALFFLMPMFGGKGTNEAALSLVAMAKATLQCANLDDIIDEVKEAVDQILEGVQETWQQDT